MINNFGLFNSLVLIVGSLLVIINIVLAPFNPYAEKNNPFECGFLSFIWQNRVQFSISFFIFALLFLLFDLEVLLVFPYFVSTYTNDIAGLVSMVIFLLLLVIGFGFELGKKALKINSKQLEITIVDIDEANKNSFVNTASISLIAFGVFLLHLAIILFIAKKLFSYRKKTNVCTWLKENTLKIFLIFFVSHISRALIRLYTNVDVFTEFTSFTSNFYYLSFATFIALVNSSDLSTDSFISWSHPSGTDKFTLSSRIHKFITDNFASSQKLPMPGTGDLDEEDLDRPWVQQSGTALLSSRGKSFSDIALAQSSEESIPQAPQQPTVPVPSKAPEQSSQSSQQPTAPKDTGAAKRPVNPGTGHRAIAPRPAQEPPSLGQKSNIPSHKEYCAACRVAGDRNRSTSPQIGPSAPGRPWQFSSGSGKGYDYAFNQYNTSHEIIKNDSRGLRISLNRYRYASDERFERVLPFTPRWLGDEIKQANSNRAKHFAAKNDLLNYVEDNLDKTHEDANETCIENAKQLHGKILEEAEKSKKDQRGQKDRPSK